MNLSKIPGSQNNSIFKLHQKPLWFRIITCLGNLMFQGKRIARHRGHLHFNHSCLREDILPKSLKFKSPINSVARKKLAKTFAFRYLKRRINELHFWINFSYNEIKKLEEKLRAVVDLEDFKII